MRPLSCGDVEAKSNQPGDALAINPRYPSVYGRSQMGLRRLGSESSRDLYGAFPVK
jgi:hypothetical protein